MNRRVKVSSQILIAIILCLGLGQVAEAAWHRVESGTFSSLRSVYFLDGQKGWIAGSRGALLTSSDAGKSWKLEKPVTQDDLLDVHFVDSENGWLLCERDIYSSGTKSVSYLRRTSDGGKTWQSIELESGRDRLIGLAFAKDGFGYAFGEGGAAWQMSDDRNKWKRLPLPVRYLIRAGRVLDSFDGVLVGGSGTALYTTDGGTGWTAASIDKPVRTKLNGIHFADSKKGWAVGAEGVILSTVNGGKMWRVQTSHVKVDLFGVSVTDAGLGVAVGDRGIILESVANGSEWITAASGVEARLEDVATTSDSVIVVGFGGTILRRN